jgi:hypothetical protein
MKQKLGTLYFELFALHAGSLWNAMQVKALTQEKLAVERGGR